MLYLLELLKQKQASPLKANTQILLIYAGMKGYLDKLSLTQVGEFKLFLIDYIQNTNILKEFDIKKSINHKVFSLFFETALKKFL